jgi:microcystin-dependent protein
MDPYLASLGLFAFGFAPRGWAPCNGQLLPINQNQALFALLGTTFGGNGQTNFALPDLRGRVGMHFGNGHNLGERSGQTTANLTTASLPPHFHAFAFQPPCNRDPGTTGDPSGNYPTATTSSAYGTPANTNMGANSSGPAVVATGNVGGNGPFNVVQPYLVLNYCIALVGVFPSQN